MVIEYVFYRIDLYSCNMLSGFTNFDLVFLHVKKYNIDERETPGMGWILYNGLMGKACRGDALTRFGY